MEARTKLGLESDASLIRYGECWEVRTAVEEQIKDGIAMLNAALKLRPDYDDAMAYMNLMYRERSDIQCGNEEASQNDQATADKWVDLVLATKKQKAEEHTPATDPRP